MTSRSPICLLLLVILPACATRQDTGRAVAAVGIASVVVAASLVEEKECFDSRERETSRPSSCASPDEGREKAAAALGAAGMGAALIGQALQQEPRGPDVTSPTGTTQAGGPGPWRLLRPSRVSFGADAGAPQFAPD